MRNIQVTSNANNYNIKDLLQTIQTLQETNHYLQSKVVELSIENAKLKPNVNNNISFADHMLMWLEHHRPNIDETTYDAYSLVLNKHIVPYFKERGIMLYNITSQDIQQYYDYKIASGLSANTVLKHHANIHKALNYACRQGKIQSNPASSTHVELPRKQQFVASFYSPTEVTQLFEVAKGTSIYTPILLTGMLGLRRSEALGLKWSSINFDMGTVHIERKVVPFITSSRLSIQKKLKNQSSNRVLPLPANLLDYLKRLKTSQSKLAGNDFICLNQRMQLMKPDTLSKQFHELLKKNNLRPIRLHDLRHSCASILTSYGYSLVQIQHWLGHSDIQTTAKYAHLYNTDKQNMANHMGTAINNMIL